ncbi:MAG: hydroxymethylbilane synthase [Rickettsiales bacterium]|jgi:hydroxymethylbilane synthase
MTAVRKILIGSRASKLALSQANEVKNLIISSHKEYQNYPDLISIISFRTSGDKIINRSLIEIGGKGLFIKEIEEALSKGQIDIAVHSMKDVPGFFQDNLDILAIPQRNDAHDAFISNKYSSISNLPLNASVGTSSPRRAALILNQRPDLKITNFRGSIGTRLNKLQENQVSATILAVAGLNRTNLEGHIASIISEEEMLPAVGQGALALQARKNDDFIRELLEPVNHQDSNICVLAERAFLKTINGSCNTPLAAYCQIKNNQLHLETLLASLDGTEIHRTSRIGGLKDFTAMGNSAGEEIKIVAKHVLADLHG